jgi:hypothetical protein
MAGTNRDGFPIGGHGCFVTAPSVIRALAGVSCEVSEKVRQEIAHDHVYDR